jgi:ligand-binding sensor domain-containing protein
LTPLSVFCQSLPFRHFTTDDGINSNTIYNIQQDNKGFLWMSTTAGICRFDGKEFVRYSIEDGLSDNEVLKIKKDKKGRLWLFGFNASISIIDDDTIYNGNTHPLLKSLFSGFFYRGIFEDNDGGIFISNKRSFSAKVYFPDSAVIMPPKSEIIFRNNNGYIDCSYKSNNPYEYKGNQFFAFPDTGFIKQWCYFNDTTLFAVTGSGITQFSKSGKITNYNIPDSLIRNSQDIYCDNEMGLWLVTNYSGVCYLQYLNGTYVIKKFFFEKENVTSVIKDSENNIWFSTHGNGVFMVPGNFNSVITYSVADGLKDNETYAVLHDSKGRLWVGHKNAKVDILKNGKIQSIQLTDKIKSVGRVIKILEHPSGVIIIGTDVGMFLLTPDGNNFRIQPFLFTNFSINNMPTDAFVIKDIKITDEGSLLVTSTEMLHYLDVADLINKKLILKNFPLPEKRYYSVCMENKNLIWYSDIEGLKFFKNNIATDATNIHPILKNRIIDIGRFQNKMLLSVEGYGLILLKDNKFHKHLSIKDGLLNNHCGRIFMEGSKAWVSNVNGINIINLDDTSKVLVDRITVADGLLSNQVNDVYVCNDTIFAATQKGISVLVNPLKNRHSRGSPHIYIMKVLANRRDVSDLVNPTISYINNNIHFYYNSPFFSFPEGVVYQYRLNNYDWAETKFASMELNSLNPGEYTFSVRARHLDSPWSFPATYSFIIPQPFYSAWWFYTLISLFAIAALLLFYQRHISRIHKEQKLKIEFEQQISRLQSQSLQAMMNPHFVFNSLNAIQQQMQAGESDKAINYLSRFARLLRMNLQHINEEYIPLKEELSRIQLYLDAEKMRLGDKLNYRIDVDLKMDTEDIILPSMIIQPFLENAIWHGIMPKENTGNLLLTVKTNLQQLLIMIDDDGIGIRKSENDKLSISDKTHFGIKLTRERLAYLQKKTNQPAIINLTEKSENGAQGTLVTIILPLLTMD